MISKIQTLKPVFVDGVIVRRTNLAEIRAVIDNHLTKEKYQKPWNQ